MTYNQIKHSRALGVVATADYVSTRSSVALTADYVSTSCYLAQRPLFARMR